MTSLSEIIAHPEMAKFATIRTDYVAIVEDRCAAMLLSILEGWTEWLKKRSRSVWVDLSGRELSEAVCGLFSRKTFMRAGKLLIELGLLARMQRNSSDRTYQYLLQLGTLQERLNLLVFWNTAARYIKIAKTAATGNWLNFSGQWLESLLGAKDPQGTLQDTAQNSSIVPPEPTLKDIEKPLEEITNTVATKNENEKPKPTPSQVEEACHEISRLSPSIRLNQRVENRISEYWDNFPAALEHLKKVVRENWQCNWIGVFMNDLKLGVPAEEVPPVAKEYPRPSLEQLDELGAMGEVVYTVLDEPGYPEILAVNTGSEVIAWWKALGVAVESIAVGDTSNTQGRENNCLD